jgi:hypothetical protein
MHIDNFAAGDSLLHRLDPRVKIVVAALFSVVVAVADRYGCLATAVSASGSKRFHCFPLAFSALHLWRRKTLQHRSSGCYPRRGYLRPAHNCQIKHHRSRPDCTPGHLTGGYLGSCLEPPLCSRQTSSFAILHGQVSPSASSGI